MKIISAIVAGLMALGTASAWAEGAGPTDAQIAAIVVTANQVDIDAGKLAKSTSKSKQVQEFAQRMITDHSGVNKSATELVTKLHVTPEANPTSESLQKGGDDNLAALKKLSGGAFDRAYVDHEVAYHQAVLDAVDEHADSQCKECGAQSPAGQGASRFRGSSGACKASADHPGQEWCLTGYRWREAVQCYSRWRPLRRVSAPATETHVVTIENMRFEPQRAEGEARRSYRVGEQGLFPPHRDRRRQDIRFRQHRSQCILGLRREQARGLCLRLHASPDHEGHADR